MILLTVTLFLIAIILFLRWHIIDRYSYFARRQIPHLTPKFPTGSFQGVTVDIHMVHWLKNQYNAIRGRSKLLGYYFGTAPIMMIADMDLAYDILVREFNTFPSAHGKWNDPLTTNLLTMEGEQWRTIRTKLSPVFSKMSMRSVLGSLQTVSDDLVTYIDQFADNHENPMNVRDVFMRYISDAISSSVLGMDTGALREDNHLLMSLGERMFRMNSSRDFKIFLFVVSYSKYLRYLPIRIFPASVSDYFIRIMDEAMRARVESNDATKNDLLDLLVRIEKAGCLTDDETGEVLGKITHNQLLGHAFMTFVFGFITSRVTLNYCLYELAMNEEIQVRLREEVLAGIPLDQEITYEKLESLVFLQQVVDGKEE